MLIPNLKCLYIFPIVATFINSVTNNVSDARVSLVFLGIFVMIQFCLIEIKDMAYMWNEKRIVKCRWIDKDGKYMVLKGLMFFNRIDRLILISEFLMIIRYVAIMLSM